MTDWAICESCGEKEYPAFTQAMKKDLWFGITVHEGICPLCKKLATLIPRRDFRTPTSPEDWD